MCSSTYELATNDDGSLAIELAANRAPYHTVAARKTGTSWRSYTAPSGNVNLQYHNYRIMVYSDQNQLILDNEGKLLTLQIPLSGELPNESQLPVVLIDKSVVLSDLQKQNVVTGQKNGLITVEEIPRPDLIHYLQSVDREARREAYAVLEGAEHRHQAHRGRME